MCSPVFCCRPCLPSAGPPIISHAVRVRGHEGIISFCCGLGGILSSRAGMVVWLGSFSLFINFKHNTYVYGFSAGLSTNINVIYNYKLNCGSWCIKLLVSADLPDPAIVGWSGMSVKKASSLFLNVSTESLLMFLISGGRRLNSLAPLEPRDIAEMERFLDPEIVKMVDRSFIHCYNSVSMLHTVPLLVSVSQSCTPVCAPHLTDGCCYKLQTSRRKKVANTN